MASGSLLDALTSLGRGLDNLPTGSLDSFANGLATGVDNINAGVIATTIKSDEFLTTLAKSGDKLDLFKKLVDIDDPGLNAAIKNAAGGDESFKSFLKTKLTPDQLKKLEIDAPPATTIDAATGAGEAIETVMKNVENINSAAAAKLESSGAELTKLTEELSSLNSTLKKQVTDARTEAISSVKNSEGLEKLADLEAEKLRMLKNDKAYERAFDIFSKASKYGIGGGVAYFAWLQYKKLQKGNEDEILCKMTCLPYSWDSATVAGFGGTVELGDSSLGYRYLEGKPQTPQSPEDVMIDESKNEEWDWDTQPLCKKAGKPNCDEYCSKMCGEIHDVVLPFEMFSEELGETLGAGVNGLFDGIGLGGLSAGVKTLIISIFSIIAIGLLFYMIFVMISKKNNN